MATVNSELHSQVAEFPACRKLLEVWEQWRGTSDVPVKQKANPEDLGFAMANVSIFELTDDDQVFIRLLATRIQEKIMQKGQGRDLLVATDESEREIRKQRYKRVISQPAGMLADNVLILKTGVFFKLKVLVLPVFDENGTRSFAYNAADILDDTPQFDQSPAEFSAVPLAVDRLFFDLSEG